MKSRLAKRVIELLKARPYGVSFRQLEEETNIPQGWINRLQQGKIAEPSVVRVEKLYEHLSETRLELDELN